MLIAAFPFILLLYCQLIPATTCQLITVKKTANSSLQVSGLAKKSHHWGWWILKFSCEIISCQQDTYFPVDYNFMKSEKYISQHLIFFEIIQRLFCDQSNSWCFAVLKFLFILLYFFPKKFSSKRLNLLKHNFL
jgi:hypothetical protein